MSNDLTLLIDGDIVCYSTAAAAEVETDWGGDLWTLHSDAAEARAAFDSIIDGWKQVLNATHVIVALTHAENFRKAILPSYKENRKSNRKPLCLKALKKHVADAYETFIRPGLEADDVLGILSTIEPTHIDTLRGQRVIVSIDKDLKTIPGFLYDPKNPEAGIQDISEAEADYWHMYQTLCGDATDGYSGLPGCGPKTAERLLAERAESSMWETVVKAFKKAKLGEQEALTQARVARILRSEDYDFKAKKPILWSPNKQEKVSAA
jgi:DNA polymerase-1